MTAVRGHVQNPARLPAIATRAPDDTRSRQDGAHSGALDARDVCAQLVAHSSRCLEQPLRGQALHEGGEGEGHRSRGGGHSLVEHGVRGVVIGLGEDTFDRSRSALSVRARPEGAEGARQVVERHG